MFGREEKEEVTEGCFAITKGNFTGAECISAVNESLSVDAGKGIDRSHAPV